MKTLILTAMASVLALTSVAQAQPYGGGYPQPQPQPQPYQGLPYQGQHYAPAPQPDYDAICHYNKAQQMENWIQRDTDLGLLWPRQRNAIYRELNALGHRTKHACGDRFEHSHFEGEWHEHENGWRELPALNARFAQIEAQIHRIEEQNRDRRYHEWHRF